MNTRQLLAIEYLNQFGEDIIFKNSYEFYIISILTVEKR
ncbi:hypothetical protein SMU26_03075 [Streptococcus mutans 3SN1]|nr:hypothetical protein SMU26_03075 [Streptococcus mutans 3SN1]